MGSGSVRRRRADAERNLNALLTAARSVLVTSGVDAPAKDITDAAGLGVGTLYRHFPRRSDLVLAVLQQEIEACADEASRLRSSSRGPGDALRLWVQGYVDLVATKRGMAEALRSEDEAVAGIRDHVTDRLEPCVAGLLADARAAGELRAELTARELLYAVALLCQRVPDADEEFNRRAVSVFLAGLRGPDATAEVS
ncbi:AcrR family transcriptional regulator [Amycolatopsis endophytica]|uniref:AcrR family transcriptional regulator n=1 Tax=Amycolatopsis endophytica TaxID=860233 RepID=A0A853BD25_9PSEU|nr:TetR/AcrR family transcriptional regulator [Amycolatopsis endophytica]NYI92326.1 AcrR family transcriptional regulator [Amycolatopsis endophytica]